MRYIFTATLVAEGSSDRMLLPIIKLLLDEYCPYDYRDPDFIEHYPDGTNGLQGRIKYAMQRYPCDVLFVHRDADRESPETREQEVRNAVSGSGITAPAIPVIPVQMTESWLLVDEAAIRQAAGNPHGTQALGLPSLRKVESLNAKDVLFDALRKAKDLGARRTQRIRPEALRHRVADYFEMGTLGSLRRLPSFAQFESLVRAHFAQP